MFLLHRFYISSKLCLRISDYDELKPHIKGLSHLKLSWHIRCNTILGSHNTWSKAGNSLISASKSDFCSAILLDNKIYSK